MTGAGDSLKLDDFIPYRLSVASNAVSKLIASTYARKFGLSIPEWRLIAVLHEDESATQQDLVSRTMMDKVSVSRAARALSKRKLIDRGRDADDGRARRVSLTAAGRKLYRTISPAALTYERMLLAKFSPAEVRRFKTMLESLETIAIRSMGADADPA